MTALKWCPVSYDHDDDPCAVCGWEGSPILPAPEGTQVEAELMERLTAAFGWCAPSAVEYEVKS